MCVERERERVRVFPSENTTNSEKNTYKNFNTLNTQINFNPLTYK